MPTGDQDNGSVINSRESRAKKKANRLPISLADPLGHGQGLHGLGCRRKLWSDDQEIYRASRKMA